MLKEKMTQELQNVRSQSAQYQKDIAFHESRIKDLQAGVQRLQGAEMILSHLLQQPEAIPAAPAEQLPDAPETNVFELKKDTADKT